VCGKAYVLTCVDGNRLRHVKFSLSLSIYLSLSLSLSLSLLSLFLSLSRYVSLSLSLYVLTCVSTGMASVLSSANRHTQSATYQGSLNALLRLY
jgi:hypothetical protein